MTDPEGRPLIDFALEQALKRNWPVHIITREEKQPLIQHLQAWKCRGLQISWQFVSATKEWPETLLLSKPFWQERNLVVLPDTRYLPLDIWDQMQTQQDVGVDVTYAVMESDDLKSASSWGVLRFEPFSLCEKPREVLPPRYFFWGLMLFRKHVGQDLLEAHFESTFDHQWKALQVKATQVRLIDFTDLTRGL